jgi:hypothetical protein
MEQYQKGIGAELGEGAMQQSLVDERMISWQTPRWGHELASLKSTQVPKFSDD